MSEAPDEQQSLYSYLSEIPSGPDLPDGFSERWEELLCEVEGGEREKYIFDGRTSKQVDRLIRRGWIVVDSQCSSLTGELTEPEPDLHPIPAVLINEYGRWVAPSALKTAIAAHPIARMLEKNILSLDRGAETEGLIRWAMSRKPTCERGEPLEADLRHAAETLERCLSKEAVVPSDSPDWFGEEVSDVKFWETIQAAIEFGKEVQKFETFGDGGLEELIELNILGVRKVADEWALEINRLAHQYSEEVGRKPTPKKLLKWLGGERDPVSDDPPLKFGGGVVPPDCDRLLFGWGRRLFMLSDGARLSGISWKEFVNRVDNANR